MEVATLAGNKSFNSFVDGIGTLARFREPRGIVFAPQRGLFVADSGNGAIRQIDPSSGAVSTIINTGMVNPVALCYHEPSESMYLMDDSKVSNSQKFIKLVDLTSNSVSLLYTLYPSSLAVGDGTLSGYPFSKLCGQNDGKFWVCVMSGTSRGALSASQNRFPSCAADSSSATPLLYILRVYGGISLNDIWRWSPGANITHMYGSQGLAALGLERVQK